LSLATKAHGRAPSPRPATGVFGRFFHRFSTLRAQFRLLAGLIALLSVALAILGGTSYGRARTDLSAIQHNSQKVVAAQTMAAAMHRVDARLPELLLKTEAGQAGALATAEPVIEAELARFEDALFLAYSNTTAGRPDAETVTIRLTPAFRGYRETVSDLLNAVRYGRAAEARASYQTATQILVEQLRPSLLRLDRLDRQDIDQSAIGARQYLAGAQVAVWLVGGLLVLLLGITTLRLTLISRRRINPGLLPALLVAIGFVALTGLQMGQTAADLRQVAQESFESLHLVVQLQDELTAARAAQNAWLIDRTQALSHDLAFGHADRQVRSMLALAVATANEQGARAEASGLQEVTTTYERFFTVDQQLRESLIQQQPERALTISSADAQAAYQATIDAADDVRARAEARFTQNLTRALGSLSTAQPLAWGAYLAIAALAVFGVSLRLREF
jgi:hypothetical protein